MQVMPLAVLVHPTGRSINVVRPPTRTRYMHALCQRILASAKDGPCSRMKLKAASGEWLRYHIIAPHAQ